MPIYHFHDADGVRNVDSHGTDLADDQAARLAAVRFAGEMLRDDPDQLWAHKQWRVEVTDEANTLLFTVITLAVEAPRPSRTSSGQSVQVSSGRGAETDDMTQEGGGEQQAS